jgi:hypothetical protein
MSNGHKVKVNLPSGGTGEGTTVQVDESTERWSEFKFADGTIIKAKVTVVSAVRVEGEYDPLGNPMYMTNLAPVMTIVSVPDDLKKKVT